MTVLQLSSYDKLKSLLLGSMVDGGETVARTELARFAETLEIAENPDDMLPYLFATALMKRLDPVRNEQMNLYLRKYDVPQIELFNLLAQKYPLVANASRFANSLLARYVHPGEPVSFLEIGIGTGRQIVSLLQELALQDRRPSSIELFAIEPNEQCLRQAQENVMVAAESCGIRVSFHPIPYEIESMPDEIWSRLAVGSSKIVNASFALHHIRDTHAGSAGKNGVLRKLSSLRPAVVVMCEPDSDHQTSDAISRFINCWQHFSLVFELIDQLDIPPEQKRALKIFFSREIEDIIGNPEHLRCERHESTAHWIDRLERAGFSPNPDMNGLSLHIPMGVLSTSDEWHIGLGAGEINLVSVICAVPKKG
ncbi:GRAS family protein [Paenibacillus prosopidis]|uniref:GRAS domain family protein n=1 Tax=Paenibacillus prosopidis TaxID=630520 RepID=A0A368W4B2_9BACL|nr:GRAS family protein [Paenibacillus prosopidis]RCW50271.1 GRAS domain family protein [Paenibacillus prosopidis]